MSEQNPLNLHPECYSGRHIWLGQHHQHSSCAPIRIIRPRRQIQSWCSSTLTSSVSAALPETDVPRSFLEALKCHLAWLRLFRHWRHFLWHQIVRSRGQSLRPQRIRVS